MGRIRGNRECFPEVSVCARRTCRYDDAFLVGVRRQPRSSWLSNPVCPPLVDVIGNCQLPCGIGDVVLRSITCPLRFDKHQFPPGFEAITPANDEAAHWWGKPVPYVLVALCVEVAWRLSADYWGLGLATEGSREIVRYAFEIIGLDALVSFTVPSNLRSRRVMDKLGMTHNPADDFDHPKLPAGHPLRRHVLYRRSAQNLNKAHHGRSGDGYLM